MRILISNDDGWDAPGIASLAEIASSLGHFTVVAPSMEQSGVSHQVTYFRPLELFPRSENVWSVDGTPADCVRIALTQMGKQFDLVLSGINNGGNLGADVYVSGTVAAAREATLFGLPAIAISQHRLRFNESFDWKHSRTLASKVIKHCLKVGIQARELININLPDFSDFEILPEVEIVDPCQLDPSPRPASYVAEQDGRVTRFRFAGKYNDRKGAQGSDVHCCFSKQIPVTRIQF